MQNIRDRLYGQIELPARAKELAFTCPVILRLREIRMANIPFLTHPSFAHVDRYEHSIGVAHLAYKWSRENNLPPADCEALSIAALYHDGATPAYGHLFEELLNWHTEAGFDHERILVELLEGRSSVGIGGEHMQVFAGGSCRLRRVLPDRGSFRVPSYRRIIDIVSGKEPLSKLIKGDIDLDNIDNVIRASSAMGLINEGESSLHPYQIVSALCLEGEGQLAIRNKYRYAIASWRRVRRQLYKVILSNPFEFRAQTAMKWAIEAWLDDVDLLDRRHSWRYTDPELAFCYLYKHGVSRALMDRNRRGNPPELLFSALLEDITPVLGKEGSVRVRRLNRMLGEATNLAAYVNYYVDKGPRDLLLPTIHENHFFNLIEKSYRFSNISSSGKRIGIIGAIAASASELERISSDDTKTLRSGRRTANEEDYKSMIKAAIGVDPLVVTSGWAYPKARVKKSIQANLFGSNLSAD